MLNLEIWITKQNFANNPQSCVQFIIVKTKIQSRLIEIFKSPFYVRANREFAFGHGIWQLFDATV